MDKEPVAAVAVVAAALGAADDGERALAVVAGRQLAGARLRARADEVCAAAAQHFPLPLRHATALRLGQQLVHHAGRRRHPVVDCFVLFEFPKTHERGVRMINKRTKTLARRTVGTRCAALSS